MNTYLKTCCIALTIALLFNLFVLQVAFADSSIALGSRSNIPQEEQNLDSLIANEITDYASIAGYSAYNWYGADTTANNIYQAAYGVGHFYSISFFIGHGTCDTWTHYWGWPWQWHEHTQYGIIADDGSTVYDSEIYDHSVYQNINSHKFVFLWSCLQGNEIGSMITYPCGEVRARGMPLAWLHTTSLSTDGYANPDGGSDTFIGFNGLGPFLTYDGFGVEDAGFFFLDLFYYAALGNGYIFSINAALDYAAQMVWGTSFGNCILHTGYSDFGQLSRLIVYGNGNIHISDLPPPPEIPSTPSGPTSGYRNTYYWYSAISPEGDYVQYEFDWGDGTTGTSGWFATGDPIYAFHSWSSLGTYNVKVRAQNGAYRWSDWSSSLTVTINNRAPNTPSTPSGPTSGIVGTSYTYSTSTTDPDGDPVVGYEFNWGDGSTEWSSTGSASHAWSSPRTYNVKVRAQDSYGLWSDWSPPLTVTIRYPYLTVFAEDNYGSSLTSIDVYMDGNRAGYTGSPFAVIPGTHTVQVSNSWESGEYKYTFNQWNDGLKDNPRTITINQDTTLTAQYIKSLKPQTEPVGYWRFNEGSGSSAGDSSPCGNDGTVYGASWTAGKLGYALSFDGEDDYVEVPDSLSLYITDEVTIAAWVYFVDGEPDGDYGGVISQLNGNVWNRLLLKGATTVLWQCQIGGIVYNHVFTLPSDQRNAWHHYALAYDGTNVRLFWDGNQVGPAQPRTGILDGGTAKPTIGRGNQPPGYHLKGSIDEVRIYNRELSAQEIWQIVNPWDLDGDGDVDLNDFWVFMGSYLTNPPADPRCDLDGDGDVDLNDFYIFMGNYLAS